MDRWRWAIPSTSYEFGFETGLYFETTFVVINATDPPADSGWAQPRYVHMAGNDDRRILRIRQGQSGKRRPGGVTCVRA